VLKTVGDSMSNPFHQLALLLKDIPLIRVHEKSVVVKVPWIGKEDIDREIMYLQSWLQSQDQTIRKWKNLRKSLVHKCEKTYKNPAKIKQCKQTYSKMLKVNEFVASVKENIHILQQYKNIPLQLYLYKKQVN
jgi:hypothetical protein